MVGYECLLLETLTVNKRIVENDHLTEKSRAERPLFIRCH